jgi:hypothetical protein
MQLRWNAIRAFVFGAIILGLTPGASAQFGSLQRTLFRGAEYAGNNLFLSSPQGGPLFENNIFRQRVEFNRAGQGYTYESFRFFGPDSFGNTDTLDLGPFKIELGIDPVLLQSSQPVGIHNRAGYTTRFIPEVFFESQTGQRSFNQFSGLTTFTPTPLHYAVTFNAGIQDFEWSGNALIDMGGRINVLGFYDFDLQFTNVGSHEANGLFLQDEQVTDFDVGPINVSGNVLFDAVAGLLQADGAATDAIPPRIFSGAAQRGKTLDELLNRLDAGEALTEQEVRFLAQEMFTAAFVSDPLGVLTNGMPSEIPGFEGFSMAVTASAQDEGVGGVPDDLAPVPEPGTLALIAAAAATLSAVSPFRRHRRRPATAG